MNEDDRSLLFVAQFARHEACVFRFVYRLHPNWSEAEDIVQETAIKLWEHWEEYDPEHPFLPWACRFAYHQVMNHRRRSKTKRKHITEAVVESLAVLPADPDAVNEAQRKALDRCLEHLSVDDRDLIQRRYADDSTIAELADQRGRTSNAMYKSLQRIRKQLFDCITRRLATEQ